jgi:acyl-CoA synthetase (AMP-forming)/AMP-acid ligase II
MIHTHSLGRAARYYPEQTAIAAGGRRPTFGEFHDRVGRVAAALRNHGFGAGDRLAILLPNEPEYLELIYACAWLCRQWRFRSNLFSTRPIWMFPLILILR